MFKFLKNKYVLGLMLVSIVTMIIIGVVSNNQNNKIIKKNQVSKEFKELKKYEDDKLSSTEKKQFSREEVDYIESINKFNSYVNQNDYKSAFDMFNRNYIKDFDITIEKLSIKYGFKNRLVSVDEIKKSTNTIVKTKFYKDLSYKEYIPIVFTFFKDGSMADLEVSEIKEYNEKTKVQGAEITLFKQYNTDTSSIFILDVLNSTSSVLNILEGDTGFYGIDEDGYEVSHKLINNCFYDIVPSKQPKRMVVEIKYFNPKKIGLKLMDNEKSVELFNLK